MKKRIRIIALVCMLVTLISSTACAVSADQWQELGDAFDPNIASVVDLDNLPTPTLPIVDETVTMTVLYPRQSQHGDFSKMWWRKALTEATGINLEFTTVEEVGWAEKMGLAFASDDLPDLFLRSLTFAEAAKYGMAGQLIPLEDLIAQYAPNAQKLLDELPDAKKSVIAPDGHIYMLPTFSSVGRSKVARTGFLNSAWVTEMPSTLDELYNCFVEIKNGDGNGNGVADEIPVSFVYNNDAWYNALVPIRTAFGFVSGRHDVIDDQYTYVPAAENYREYLRFLKKLWDEDLMDHDVFTQTQEQYMAKLSSNRVGLTSDEMKNFFTDTDLVHNYVCVGPLTSEWNQKKMWPAMDCIDLTSGCFAITSACKDPVTAIKLADYFYSLEGSMLTKCGPKKGEWDGEGGWSVTTDENGKNHYTVEFDKTKYTGYWNFRCAHGPCTLLNFYSSEVANCVVGADKEAELISWQCYKRGCYDNRRLGYPTGVAFTEDEQEELAIEVMIDAYADRMTAEFINGTSAINDDAAWQKYIDTLNSMGLDTVSEVRQTAYDRWNNADK